MSDAAVAVVGLAGRFPGARNVDEFWTNLRHGAESIRYFSRDELLVAGVDPELLARPEYVRARAVLDDIEWFDAACFGINAREAELMDPQHRLFLECALESIEHSGHAPESYKGAIGIFAGTGLSHYLLHNLSGEGQESSAGAHIGIGNVQDFLATRVAYKLNLTGPAYTVQSACSTSLVAVHVACQNLLNYECDLALAGGVSVMLPANCGYLYQENGMLSPDGHCRPFDAAAQGTVFGSGVGVVALKRLADALADGDTIHAVVLGSAVNNDGSVKAGYTAPSVNGQASVIAEALANADVTADTITYVECHGTGTSLGDPIEIAALAKAFRAHTDRTRFCAVGAVKSNIGHLDSAAGIAGFIKTVLALRHRELPPTLHFTAPNPRIDFETSPFYVNASLQQWEVEAMPRRAGVSGFGVGGTNAHVILEEAPAPARSRAGRAWHVLPLSARSAAALTQARTALADTLQAQPGLSIADVAMTLQVGRRAGEHRCAVVCRTLGQAADAFRNPASREVLTGIHHNTAIGRVVFLFPGLGAQHAGMGAGLYAAEPVFRQAFDRCSALLGPGLGIDLREMVADTGDSPPARDRMRRTDYGEPALFAFEYALAQLLASWKVVPDAMIGHSIGEYAAASLAGVFTLEGAAALVVARARLLRTLPPGAMLAVALPAETLRPLLTGQLSIAVVNSPTASVVAGPPASIAELESSLARRGVSSRRLDCDRALQSHMTEPILAEFGAAVRQVERRPPAVPFVSNVTGRWMTAAEATDVSYWVRQFRQTVYFADGIRELLKDPDRIFVEVGPGMTLSALARQNVERGRSPAIFNALPDPRERKPELASLLTTVARLWLAGVAIDWQGLHAGERHRRVPLPGYPFERQRFWIDPPPAIRSDDVRREPKRSAAEDFFYLPIWKQSPLVSRAASRPPGRRWLVFAGAGAGGRDFISALEAEGRQVITVVPGHEFAAQPAFHFAIRPGDRSHYERLIETLVESDALPDVVVHAWLLGDAAGENAEAGVAGDGRESGFYSLLHLGQALAKTPVVERPLRIAVLTQELYEVDGSEQVNPGHALAMGPCLVMGHEWPSMTCQNIDVGRNDARAMGPLAHRVGQELDAETNDPSVAIRGSQRFVRSYEPAQLKDVSRLSRLKPGGVYLITGGFGGICATLAEHLADSSARLVLIGRTRVPPRETWDDWLAGHPDGEQTSARIAWLRSLEAKGAEVLVASADVASEPDLSDVVRAAVERFGRIDGVIHAAGVPGGGIIPLKTHEASERVLAPKVDGTRVLERVLRGQRLDFIVLCSSLESLAGSAGQVDYCAANAFLDAWAHRQGRQADGTLVVSINWDAWGEVGMAVNTAVPESWRQARQEQLAWALTPREGVEVFRRVLEQSLSQVLVSTTPLADRLRPRLPQADASALTTLSTLHPRPALQTDYVEARSEMEKQLAGIWQRALGIGPIGINDNFFDLGGDSLTALRLISQLKAFAGLDCTVPDFYAAPTVKLLAGRISETASGAFHPAAPVNS